MTFVSLDIVEHLKTLTLSPEVSNIRLAHSKLPPSYPMITVQEIQNATKIAIVGEERFSTLGYQIDIFCKDAYPLSGAAACRQIASTVDTAVQSEYGLTRETYIELPDVDDISVSRISLRYTGVIDVKSDIMYR